MLLFIHTTAAIEQNWLLFKQTLETLGVSSILIPNKRLRQILPMVFSSPSQEQNPDTLNFLLGSPTVAIYIPESFKKYHKLVDLIVNKHNYVFLALISKNKLYHPLDFLENYTLFETAQEQLINTYKKPISNLLHVQRRPMLTLLRVLNKIPTHIK